MKKITRSCFWCTKPFEDTIDRRGQAKRYCSKVCQGKAVWARHIDRLGLEAEAHIDESLQEAPAAAPTAARPFSWWVAQACQINETCRKCEGPVQGVYVPPTQANMGECAVVAHCRLCGSERMVISGRGGVPYEEPQPMTEEELARAREKSEQGRRGVYVRQWRPARVKKG